MMTFPAVLPTGMLLPESILHSDSFKMLATFVALNTLMYVTLAVLKVLPKGYVLSRFSGRNRRTQNRSIYPEPPASQRGSHYDERVRADGYGADIELTETAVVIHSGKAAAKIQGTDTITVPYGDIASIEYRSANPLVNGQMNSSSTWPM